MRRYNLGLCHCGLPLHYTDPAIQARIQKLVDSMGGMVPVENAGKTYLVQRHYIALHGLKPADLGRFIEVYPIDTAPTDGTMVGVYAAPAHGLPGFTTRCDYHPFGGWCVDELRPVTHWWHLTRPL